MKVELELLLKIYKEMRNLLTECSVHINTEI